MKNLNFIKLKIDDIHIQFCNGINYIIGKNASGKSTIFNCIKYVLGLTKNFNNNVNIQQIELIIMIDTREYRLVREVGNRELIIFTNENEVKLVAGSTELNIFYQKALYSKYLFNSESNSTSVLKILDFCFLTEEKTIARKNQWQILSAILGVDDTLLNSIEQDINLLKNEIKNNKRIEKELTSFVDLLNTDIDSICTNTDIRSYIDTTKKSFLKNYKEKEELLLSASLKFEEMKNKAEYEIKSKLYSLNEIFLSMKANIGNSQNHLENLEEFIKGKSQYMSYGEEVFSRYLLMFAVTEYSNYTELNFPNLIINDNYLLGSLDLHSIEYSNHILKKLTSENSNFQYIEFTHKEDISSEYIVYNLNTKGSRYD